MKLLAQPNSLDEVVSAENLGRDDFHAI